MKVDGFWDNWISWSDCSSSCGTGQRKRARSCFGPQHGGSECEGVTTEIEPCNTHPCPVDGKWRSWSVWANCTLPCGSGIRSRIRQCVPPQHGGRSCNGISTESESCNEHPCPVDGQWNTWSNWLTCSRSCGNGTTFRTRNCIPPRYGGQNCSGDGQQLKACNTRPCPVDGYWSNWGNWSQCSKSCGGGASFRYRDCSPPLYGGENCTGLDIAQQECNTRMCPSKDECSVSTIWE
ncbi:adhesion G protein-coupled receptor B3-like [Tubulanus polymorphus]|uniref:adhesion G protein-coupled receptor B3-like n=1 Tax=Tubulanus polymorphus TaxID=672921 RepID=UPI003DA5B1F1